MATVGLEETAAEMVVAGVMAVGVRGAVVVGAGMGDWTVGAAKVAGGVEVVLVVGRVHYTVNRRRTCALLCKVLPSCSRSIVSCRTGVPLHTRVRLPPHAPACDCGHA